jgi:hypothetical protein
MESSSSIFSGIQRRREKGLDSERLIVVFAMLPQGDEEAMNLCDGLQELHWTG